MRRGDRRLYYSVNLSSTKPKASSEWLKAAKEAARRKSGTPQIVMVREAPGLRRFEPSKTGEAHPMPDCCMLIRFSKNNLRSPWVVEVLDKHRFPRKHDFDFLAGEARS